jgi:putative DNA methylase
MADYPIKSPRKLIEVGLPLDAINVACAYEKMPGIGAHPRGIHLWWARRPLAAARAILFAQLVNDPGYQQGAGFKYGKNKKEAAIERKRLFKIIEDLVKWENSTKEEVLEPARAEIRRSWREVCELNKSHPQAAELFNPDRLPAFHDPFAGGGAIPLEAQRLGLESYASDLNPVAVLINKAMIEIPPKFVGRAPVGPEMDNKKGRKLALSHSWAGATGLAEDVRRYGAWMRAEAQKRIGHLYPPVEITTEIAKDYPGLDGYVGKKLPVIAWLWARTVKCPNPACEMDMPLLSSFVLSTAKNNEAFLVPKVTGKKLAIDISSIPPSHLGTYSKGYKRGMSGIFECAFCGTVTTRDYTAEYATQKGLGVLQTAVVCKTSAGRVYLPAKFGKAPDILPAVDLSGLTIELAKNPRDVWCRNFGLTTPADLFTPRQLVAMTTFCDLVTEVRQLIRQDAISAGVPDDGKGLELGGSGATSYAEAVSVYLAFAVDRCADFSNSVTRWVPGNQKVMNLFGKQVIPMAWDFPEAAILADTVGGFAPSSEYIADCINKLSPAAGGGATQSDAQTQTISTLRVVSTDPPYYDNIGYADLSDFFYVWLRKSLRSVFPSLLATMAVPKLEELVALPYRFKTKIEAEKFFLDGMTQVIHNIARLAHPAGPVTIYYAFKQSETNKSEGTSSTGWETFLTAVLQAGFSIVGTWPLRSEQEFRIVSMGTNALASSIVLVCRKRPADASSISRREFIRELNGLLPEALDEMTKGTGGEHSPVAPVDLSQAIIGPGMAVFSKYTAVLEADGSPMSVRTALQLINRFLAEDDFDADTQFCLHWFEQFGWGIGESGVADGLARAKNTSENGLVSSGVIFWKGGKTRLLKWAEYPSDWDPRTDLRLPVWEALHQLIRALKQGGESASGALLAALGGKAEAVRQLAYRLYTLCERLGQAEDARAYNDLITSWSGIEAAANSVPKPAEPQGTLFEG